MLGTWSASVGQDHTFEASVALWRRSHRQQESTTGTYLKSVPDSRLTRFLPWHLKNGPSVDLVAQDDSIVE